MAAAWHLPAGPPKNPLFLHALAIHARVPTPAVEPAPPRPPLQLPPDVNPWELLAALGAIDAAAVYGVTWHTEFAVRAPRLLVSGLQPRHLLGVGSFGSVWAAADGSGSALSLAVKQFNMRVLLETRQAHRALRELRALERLRHPFIVPLCGVDADADYLYLVLPLAHGGTLHDAVARPAQYGVARYGVDVYGGGGAGECRVGGLHTDAARFIGAALLCVLSHLHSRGVVYRDLKSDNVLLRGNGYPWLADFGFARSMTTSATTVTASTNSTSARGGIIPSVAAAAAFLSSSSSSTVLPSAAATSAAELCTLSEKEGGTRGCCVLLPDGDKGGDSVCFLSQLRRVATLGKGVCPACGSYNNTTAPVLNTTTATATTSTSTVPALNCCSGGGGGGGGAEVDNALGSDDSVVEGGISPQLLCGVQQLAPRTLVVEGPPPFHSLVNTCLHGASVVVAAAWAGASSSASSPSLSSAAASPTDDGTGAAGRPHSVSVVVSDPLTSPPPPFLRRDSLVGTLSHMPPELLTLQLGTPRLPTTAAGRRRGATSSAADSASAASPSPSPPQPLCSRLKCRHLPTRGVGGSSSREQLSGGPPSLPGDYSSPSCTAFDDLSPSPLPPPPPPAAAAASVLLLPTPAHPTSLGSADIYSLGVLLFEALTGSLPFGDGSGNAVLLAERVSSPTGWAFPPTLAASDPIACSLISACLARDPDARPSAGELQSHAWFAGFDWAALETGTMASPFQGGGGGGSGGGNGGVSAAAAVLRPATTASGAPPPCSFGQATDRVGGGRTSSRRSSTDSGSGGGGTANQRTGSAPASASAASSTTSSSPSSPAGTTPRAGGMHVVDDDPEFTAACAIFEEFRPPLHAVGRGEA